MADMPEFHFFAISLGLSDKIKKMMRKSVWMGAQILLAIEFLERTLPHYLSQPKLGPFETLYGNWTLVVEFSGKSEQFFLIDILFTPPADFDEFDNLDAITDSPTNAELVLQAKGLLTGIPSSYDKAPDLYQILVVEWHGSDARLLPHTEKAHRRTTSGVAPKGGISIFDATERDRIRAARDRLARELRSRKVAALSNALPAGDRRLAVSAMAPVFTIEDEDVSGWKIGADRAATALVPAPGAAGYPPDGLRGSTAIAALLTATDAGVAPSVPLSRIAVPCGQREGRCNGVGDKNHTNATIGCVAPSDPFRTVVGLPIGRSPSLVETMSYARLVSDELPMRVWKSKLVHSQRCLRATVKQ